MKTYAVELQMGHNKISQDPSRNVALFNFYGASAATKICFRASNDICSDFTYMDCVTISVN